MCSIYSQVGEKNKKKDKENNDKLWQRLGKRPIGSSKRVEMGGGPTLDKNFKDCFYEEVKFDLTQNMNKRC